MLTMPFGLIFGSWHVGIVYLHVRITLHVILMPIGNLVMGHTDSLFWDVFFFLFLEFLRNLCCYIASLRWLRQKS